MATAAAVVVRFALSDEPAPPRSVQDTALRAAPTAFSSGQPAAPPQPEVASAPARVTEASRFAALCEHPERVESDLLAAAMRDWAEQDADAAWAWLVVHRAEIDDLAHGALPAIVLRALAKEPHRLLSLVGEVLRSAREGDYALSPGVLVPSALSALIDTGQAEVAQVAVDLWLPGSGHAGATLAAYTLVSTALAREAPEAAGEWLRQHAASPERDVAMDTLLNSWAESDGAGAMRWVESLPAFDRASAAASVFAEWLQHDEARAIAWLETAVTREGFADQNWDRILASVLAFAQAPRRDPALAARLAQVIADPVRRLAAGRHAGTALLPHETR